MRKRRKPTRVCPHCQAIVPRSALACAECGSDARTGWADLDELAGASLELPETELDDRDYEEFLARDLGQRPSKRTPPWVVIVIALVVIAMLLALVS
ncbi:MAG: hypothetical protein U1E76_25465 [Planctomycetota bacterium]